MEKIKSLLLMMFALLILSCCNRSCNNDDNLKAIKDTPNEDTLVINSELKSDSINHASNDFADQEKSTPERNRKEKENISPNQEKIDQATNGVSGTQLMTIGDIYQHFQKTPQWFDIPANKDTIIVCNEGTVVRIPANSFIFESTGKEIFTNLRISITEYYKISDIILANLSTKSGNDILETGGMINILVSSEGENCILKEKQEIEIGFPSTAIKEDMELFSGNWKNDNIDWEPMQRPAIDMSSELDRGVEVERFTVVEKMPAFPGDDDALKKYLSENVKYTLSALKNKIEGTVYLTFVVDETGRVSDPRILRGIDPGLDKVAFTVVKKMPYYIPGLQRGRPVPVQFNLPVKFSLEGIEISDAVIAESKKIEEEVKNVLVVYSDEKSTFNKMTFKEEIEKLRNDGNSEYANILEMYSYYLSSTPQTGWINLDRYYKKNFQIDDYKISNEVANEFCAKIIFNNSSIILTQRSFNGNCTFVGMPMGVKVTLAAFQIKNNEVLLATKETTLNRSIVNDLVYEPVTMAELKEKLRRFD